MKKRSVYRFALTILLTGTLLSSVHLDAAGQTVKPDGDETITERIREELEAVLQNEEILGDNFELIGMTRATESSDWPDGYCLEIRYSSSLSEDIPNGEICYFQDGKEGLPELERLDYFHFSGGRHIEKETIGHFSGFAMYAIPGVKDDNALTEYRGAFVKDAWIGDFHLPELPFENNQFLYTELINKILNALPASFTKDVDAPNMTQTQLAIFDALDTQFNSAQIRFGFTGGGYYRESWAGAEFSYCFDMYSEVDMGAGLCLFRDQAADQEPSRRLESLREFNWWWGEIVDENLLDGADGSLLIVDENDPSGFNLAFVFGEWVGNFGFYLPDQQAQNHYETFNVLSQNVFSALENLPADLPLQETTLVNGDILKNLHYSVNLPEGYSLGPVLRFDDNRDPRQFIYQQGVSGPVGEIHYSQVLDSITRYNGFGDFSELVSDPNVLGVSWPDRKNDRSIVYNLNKDALVAQIQLGEKDIKVSEAIGQALYAAIREPRNKAFPYWDEELEENIWRCFPEDDQMLLSEYMPAYTRSIQYSSDGYTYHMDYSNDHQVVPNTGINLRVFAYQPSRIDLLSNGSFLEFHPKIGENLYYSFAEGNSYDEDIQFHMIEQQENTIIDLSSKVYDVSFLGRYFPYTWLNDPENTFVKDIYTQLAEEMSTCLAGEQELYAITLPGEMNEESLDESYLRASVILTDDVIGGPPMVLDLSAVPSFNLLNWSTHGIYLEMWFSRVPTGPLTFAIYNEKYDTVLYLQQNKYLLDQDYIYTQLSVNRENLFEGENILLVWMEDTLIARKPFLLYRDEGAME